MSDAALGRYPDSEVHGANMGPTWVLSAPDGPHDPCYLGMYAMSFVSIKCDIYSTLVIIELDEIVCFTRLYHNKTRLHN